MGTAPYVAVTGDGYHPFTAFGFPAGAAVSGMANDGTVRGLWCVVRFTTRYNALVGCCRRYAHRSTWGQSLDVFALQKARFVALPNKVVQSPYDTPDFVNVATPCPVLEGPGLTNVQRALTRLT